MVVSYCWYSSLFKLCFNFKTFTYFFAFPAHYANLNPLGQFSNLDSVTNEVKLMMDPNG